MGLLAACSASAQVLWHADFEAPVWWSTSSQYYNTAPAMSATVIDVGPPQNHVLWMSANCTNQVQPWWVAFEFAISSGPVVTYDPSHAYLKFDILVSKLRPCHARVDYWGPGLDASDMDIDVTPTATNTFQTFFVPMSACTNSIYVITGGGFTGMPSAIRLAIQGDPAQPDTTWPSDPDNIFMVDNITYIVSPPLSIAAPNAGTLVLTWPTNTAGFVVQQTTDLNAGNWTTITNTPVLTNGSNQLVLPNAPGQSFYRLSGP